MAFARLFGRPVWLGGSQFDSVDVHRNFRDETSWLSNYILKKVIRFSNPDTGELEGDIASQLETPDSPTYTFQLNKHHTWHATPITPATITKPTMGAA